MILQIGRRAVGTVLLLAACSGPPEIVERPDLAEQPSSPPAMAAPTFEYRIGPGDVLRVNVFEHPQLSSGPWKSGVPGSPVAADGSIALPLIGEIDAHDATVFEVQERVAAALSTYLKQPRVDVAVIEHGAHRAFVIGEVQQPGMFILDRPMTVLELVSQTRGFTAFANREQVALVRGAIREENITILSLDDLDPLAQTWVQGGDIVFVGRRAWAEVAQAAQDLVPILQAISLPVSTVRDVAIFQDIREN